MSGDCCATKNIGNLLLQENGIIRNSNGRIIAKLCDDVAFNSEHVAVSVQKFNPVIDTCDFGHNYAKLPDHPKDTSGRPRCPICMSNGLDGARTELKEAESMIEWFTSWFIENRPRNELNPCNHEKQTRYNFIARLRELIQ